MFPQMFPHLSTFRCCSPVVEELIFAPQFCDALAGPGFRMKPLSGDLGSIWVRGAPSLLGRAIFHLSREFSRMSIYWADLYSQRDLYSGVSEARRSQERMDFRVTDSKAKHDLRFNFRVLTKLLNSGITVGGPDFVNLLSRGEENYISLLRVSLGESRQ